MINPVYISYAFAYTISKFSQNYKLDQKEQAGFLENHEKKFEGESMGNFSIITYNMEPKNELNSTKQKEELVKLIDNTHAPILCLQEISKEDMDKLKLSILPHYDSVAYEESLVTDPGTGMETYSPILYDTKELQHIKSGSFKTADLQLKNSYASWAQFKRINENFVFTVINLDLYSIKSDVNKVQLASILKHIKETPEVKQSVVFLVGTINASTDEMKKLYKKQFVKLSDMSETQDQQNTLDTYLDALYNTERDVVLALNTQKIRAQPLYSSVLKKMSYGARFPIQVIFNLHHQ